MIRNGLQSAQEERSAHSMSRWHSSARLETITPSPATPPQTPTGEVEHNPPADDVQDALAQVLDGVDIRADGRVEPACGVGKGEAEDHRKVLGGDNATRSAVFRHLTYSSGHDWLRHLTAGELCPSVGSEKQNLVVDGVSQHGPHLEACSRWSCSRVSGHACTCASSFVGARACVVAMVGRAGSTECRRGNDGIRWFARPSFNPTPSPSTLCPHPPARIEN